MSIDPHSRRFDPRRLFPVIESDWDEASEEPDVYRFCPAEESTNDRAGRDFDEALQQITSGGDCICPLCGAIVAGDGTIVR